MAHHSIHVRLPLSLKRFANSVHFFVLQLLIVMSELFIFINILHVARDVNTNNSFYQGVPQRQPHRCQA